MPAWCIELEKKLDEYALDGPHARNRIFLTSDPSKGIPIGILNRSIKMTNEPPGGLKANLKRAITSFNADQFDELEGKSRAILFGLCFFHAILIERKMYGPLGFNMMYPFSLGDLRDSSVCLQNYMEANAGGKIPWADLRYIFGEIMYGGHIVNDFDRLLANSYLDWILKDELLLESELFPFADGQASFKSPNPERLQGYLEHIDAHLKVDTPLAFGLHPNAEIDFRTQQSESLFLTLQELQPRDGISGEGGESPQHVAESVQTDILDRFGDKRFDIEDIIRNIEDQGPYQNVFLQECERMNSLLNEVSRSLNELALGFAGELTMSESMEDLMQALFMDRVPSAWTSRAWPSLRPLSSWLHNMSRRLLQLEDWTQEPMEIPRVTWLSGLINPQSFLTAISQVTAQKNQLELDKLEIFTELTKKSGVEAVEELSRDGAYIHGLSLQGARWEMTKTQLEVSRPKEMFCDMPIINCKALTSDRIDTSNYYECPCYKTNFRGPTYVFSAQLKSKDHPAKWCLAGVALIMDIS